MQPDKPRPKTRRRFQWRLLLLLVVVSMIALFLLTQRVTAPPLTDPLLLTATHLVETATVLDSQPGTLTMGVPFDTTLTLVDPIWQTATAFHIERLPELMTITQEALTATRTLSIITPAFPTMQPDVIAATAVGLTR